MNVSHPEYMNESFRAGCILLRTEVALAPLMFNFATPHGRRKWGDGGRILRSKQISMGRPPEIKIIQYFFT